MVRFELINDSYRQSRGPWSRLRDVRCKHCNQPIMLYQKDGAGILKRAYLDRIFSPKKLIASPPQKLRCHSCKQILAVLERYDKEPRDCYVFDYEKVTKKIIGRKKAEAVYD